MVTGWWGWSFYGILLFFFSENLDLREVHFSTHFDTHFWCDSLKVLQKFSNLTKRISKSYWQMTQKLKLDRKLGVFLDVWNVFFSGSQKNFGPHNSSQVSKKPLQLYLLMTLMCGYIQLLQLKACYTVIQHRQCNLTIRRTTWKDVPAIDWRALFQDQSSIVWKKVIQEVWNLLYVSDLFVLLIFQ